jgi:hypothetical protein
MLLLCIFLITCFAILLCGISRMGCVSLQQTNTRPYTKAFLIQAAAHRLAVMAVHARSAGRPVGWMSGHNALLWIASGRYTP